MLRHVTRRPAARPGIRAHTATPYHRPATGRRSRPGGRTGPRSACRGAAPAGWCGTPRPGGAGGPADEGAHDRAGTGGDGRGPGVAPGARRVGGLQTAVRPLRLQRGVGRSAGRRRGGRPGPRRGRAGRAVPGISAAAGGTGRGVPHRRGGRFPTLDLGRFPRPGEGGAPPAPDAKHPAGARAPARPAPRRGCSPAASVRRPHRGPATRPPGPRTPAGRARGRTNGPVRR